MYDSWADCKGAWALGSADWSLALDLERMTFGCLTSDLACHSREEIQQLARI